MTTEEREELAAQAVALAQAMLEKACVRDRDPRIRRNAVVASEMQ
jgi:hypothetical protein